MTNWTQATKNVTRFIDMVVGYLITSSSEYFVTDTGDRLVFNDFVGKNTGNFSTTAKNTGNFANQAKNTGGFTESSKNQTNWSE